MSEDHYLIRTMRREDIDVAVEWAAREGWNPGLHDADCFFAADNTGFLIGELDGMPVSCISVVSYGGGFGFLGFYIVKPDFRGQGYGIKIWNAGLEYLSGHTIGLDGVVAQQDNYRKSGFVLAYRNVRYEGHGADTEKMNPSGIVDLRDVPFETLHMFDHVFFAANRKPFLKQWITRPGVKALGIMGHGDLAGYGVLRPCRNGFKIGPLFADKPDYAETLLNALISGLRPESPFYLDIPEINREAVALVKKHDMKMVFETARMYKGQAPQLPVERIFGVTSFELG